MVISTGILPFHAPPSRNCSMITEVELRPP